MPDTQKDVARLGDFVCVGETPFEGELFELAPDIVKIQITDDDIIDYCQRLKDFKPEEIETLSKAIKARDLTALSTDYFAFVQVTAMYVKHYRKRDLLRLIEISLSLDKGDMSYLKSIGLPSNECVFKDNVSVMLVCNEKATDFVQGILSKDLRPQTHLDERLQKELRGKLLTTAHRPVYDILFRLSSRNSDPQGNTAGHTKTERDMSPSERRKARKAKENATGTENTTPENCTVLTKKDKYNLRLTLQGKDGKVWRPSAIKLLKYAFYKLTSQNNFPVGQNHKINRDVSFTYDEWLALTERENTKSNVDNMYKRVKQDCKVILGAALEWDEPKGAKKPKNPAWTMINIATRATIKNGVITIAISPETSEYLLNGYITQFPIGLLAVDERNTSAFAMGNKLSEHYYNNSNKRNGRNDILSVESLLDCSDYPSKEEVMEKHASKYRVYIIEPFINAMNELSEKMVMQWNFCNAGKEPLAETQHPEKDIDDFLKMYISFEFHEETAPEKTLQQDNSTTSGEKKK